MTASIRIPFNPLAPAVSAADEQITRVIDITTDPLYTYVSETYLDDAATGDPVWRNFRIVNATGTRRFMTNPATNKRTSAFMFTAASAPGGTY